MSKIKNIFAREILASGGAPKFRSYGHFGKWCLLVRLRLVMVPSAGSKEATVLLDGDKARFGGKGMLKAIANINGMIRDNLIGVEADKQRDIDTIMIDLDGTINKAVLGGNAMLGVSLAVCRAQAAEENMPLYKYLRKTYGIGDIGWKLPKPMIVDALKVENMLMKLLICKNLWLEPW